MSKGDPRQVCLAIILMKIINPQKCVVFFDFDNTIATCDVFDSMLPRFSKDNLWVKLEKEWESGKIGSHACLKGQIKGIVLQGSPWISIWLI